MVTVMAVISIKKTVRETKTVNDLKASDFILTKQKDVISLRLDNKSVKDFNDREAFMDKLFAYLTDEDNKDIITTVFNS